MRFSGNISPTTEIFYNSFMLFSCVHIYAKFYSVISQLLQSHAVLSTII